MYSTPAGYPQPVSQQQYSQRPQYTGPPPAKKAKGNPIITRYPPPPGYKGPAQPQAPYQAPAWPQPGHPYAYPQPSFAGYPQQHHVVPQPYQQPQWSGHQHPPYAPVSYPPQPGYYTGQTTSPAWQHPTSTPHSAPPQHWQGPGPVHQQEPRRHNSAPFPFHASALVDGNGDPFPVQELANGAVNDLEDDFESECYFARRPDEIDPAFSIGIIEWKAPRPSKCALPATHGEAELEALAPKQRRAAEEESVSQHFTNANRDEVLLSIRQTDEWSHVKDDLIFREFPPASKDIISMPELYDNFRVQFDPHWTQHARTEADTPTPDQSRSPSPSGESRGSNEHDRGYRRHKPFSQDRRQIRVQDDMLDHLEQALHSDHGDVDERGNRSSSRDGYYQRTASISSETSERLSRPKAVIPVRDAAQEDVLAALGVTGGPKKFYQTPGPVHGPPPQQRTSRHNSFHSLQNGNHSLPRPPPPPSYDSYMHNGHHTHGNGYSEHRPESSGSQQSQHTAPGSDFQLDDHDATPRPHLNRNDSRKRAFDDSDHIAYNNKDVREDDATPKQRRKHARVDRGGAYDRRW